MVEDGYWFASEVVDNFYPSYIGMYGDTRDNTYWFWHSFVTVDGVIADGVDVTVMYQMGDEDSHWEGVHIQGETNMNAYHYHMQHRTLSNAGWNQDTPETPGSCGCELDGTYKTPESCGCIYNTPDTCGCMDGAEYVV